MTLIPFAPPPGLNSDDTSFKAEGRWADCRNVRFVQGSPQVMGEFKSLFSTLGGGIYNMFAIDRSGTTHIAYGLTASVYVGSGVAAPTARTPASMGTGYTAYAFAAWGDQILFVPSGKTLYEQTGTSTATEITNAPDRITWMLVTPERQVLALGCNEEVSTTFNGRCIRGCDLEDYTDWTTSATNNAFEHILEGGGQIVTGRLIGSYVAVWTDTALHLGTFIGDPAQTYRFDRVAAKCGVVGPNAVTLVGLYAYWLGHDLKLRRWTPGGEVELVPCPILQAMVNGFSLSSGSRAATHVTFVSKYNEIWIQPDAGNSDGFALGLGDMTWWRTNVQRSAVLCDDLIQRQTNGSYTTNVIAADATGLVYAHECGNAVVATGPTSWYIQSADQYLDNSQRRMMVRGVLPDFLSYDPNNELYLTNQQSVALTLFVRERPGSSDTTKGPYTIAAAATKKDFRATGKIMAVKLAQTTNVDRELRMGKTLFDMIPTGER